MATGSHSSSRTTLLAHSPHLLLRQIYHANAEALRRCIADSSRATYGTAWNSWTEFSNFFGFNALCLDDDNVPLSTERCVHLLECYSGFECGVRQLKPTTVFDTYVPGICKFLDIQGVSSIALRNARAHPYIKAIQQGYVNMWAAKHPDHQRAKIPFTLVLARQTEDFLLNGRLRLPSPIPHANCRCFTMGVARITTALLFGIFFLLRKGEFLPKPAFCSTRHPALLRSHIRFLDDSQHEIPYPLIGIRRAWWVTITILFSKTDRTGRGRILTHYADPTTPHNCIVQRLEAYFVMSRDWFGAAPSSPLFDIPDFPTLSTDVLTRTMRETCTLLGLPSDNVSAHSLRYGGATTLAAAGFPEYVIAFYGGWAPDSKAMRTYIKPSNEIVKRVSTHMTRAHASLAVQAAVNQILAHRVPTVPPHRRS